MAPQIAHSARAANRYLNGVQGSKRRIQHRSREEKVVANLVAKLGSHWKSDQDWMPEDVRNARPRRKEPLGRRTLQGLLQITEAVIAQGGGLTQLQSL
jgi:hypothetical protein